MLAKKIRQLSLEVKSYKKRESFLEKGRLMTIVKMLTTKNMAME